MIRLYGIGLFVLVTAAWSAWAAPLDQPISAPDGWTAAAPREEIRPVFAHEATGGTDGKGLRAFSSFGPTSGKG
jgi:hypothetical protein